LKNSHLKQLYFLVAAVFSAVCVFTSCHELLPKPIKTADTTASNSNVAKDSLKAVDSLPSFNNPTGVAVDPSGNIYVADYGNNLIREITTAGMVSTFAGSGNQGAINATGLLASFSGPAGITIDASGNLYVADAGSNLIRKITTSAVVTTLAGGDTTAMTNGIGANASFSDPLGVTVDPSGNVFVADAGDNMVRMITPSGLVSTLAGTAVSSDSLTVNSVFNNPTGVAVDAADNVFVADYLNNNILLVNTAGIVTTLAGTGLQGNNNGPNSSATFYYPNSVAVDANDNVYVADGINNLIRKISPNGVVSTLAGSGVAGAIDSTGTAASFNGPSGLAVDASGNVYVADTNNNLIRKITPAGVVTTIAGNGQPGSNNGKVFAHRNTKPIKTWRKIKINIFYRKPSG